MNIKIKVKNIRSSEMTQYHDEDFTGYYYDLVVNNVVIRNLFEHDSVINCECSDTYYDTCRSLINDELTAAGFDDGVIDYVIDRAFSVIHESLSLA